MCVKVSKLMLKIWKQLTLTLTAFSGTAVTAVILTDNWRREKSKIRELK